MEPVVDRAAETLPLPDGKQGGEPQPERPKGRIKRIKAFFGRHKMLLWWLHSAYALFLGVMVILFAQKGFEHARVLAATLGGALIAMLVVFRIFGVGKEQKEKVHKSRGSKIRFLLITYLLKNLYQPMLFFVLPFYWKASSIDSVNGWFVFLLGILAFLSTMDIIFDRFLVRHRVWAASYYGLTLFACLNLVIPALFPNVPTIVTLLSSAFLSVVGFWLLHFPLGSLKEKRSWLILLAVALAFTSIVYVARRGIPPVPLYVQHGAVGPERLPDGRLALEVGAVHESRLGDMWAVTEVALPGGEGDTFRHVWRYRDGDFTQDVATEKGAGEAKGTIRLTSALKRETLPAKVAGRWTVDVMTEEGQIVGRTRFEVLE